MTAQAAVNVALAAAGIRAKVASFVREGTRFWIFTGLDSIEMARNVVKPEQLRMEDSRPEDWVALAEERLTEAKRKVV